MCGRDIAKFPVRFLHDDGSAQELVNFRSNSAKWTTLCQ